MNEAAVSRRSVVKTLGARTLVVGFSAITGSWVTSARADASSGFDRLPALDGSLHLDEATRSAYAHDFGDMARYDRVLMLDGGCLVEQGAHHTLMAARGRYLALVERRHG